MPEPQLRVRWARVLILGGSLLMLLALVAAQLARPLPAPRIVRDLPRSIALPGNPTKIPWPPHGQAVVDLVGVGRIGSFGDTEPVPIASVAKVMTALVVLRDHPLRPGQQGPEITIEAVDEQRYRTAERAESLLPVKTGDTLTQREALEALLVASANNIAELLARWDAGSEEAFVKKMNATARKLGLRNTTYADSVGLSDKTVSTASDQVAVAEEAMEDATFADIVSRKVVDLPGAARLPNYNSLVGSDGVVGVKTGSSKAAGGCLVFAVRREIGGKPRLIVGAVLSQRGGSILPTVLARTKLVAKVAGSSLQEIEALPDGRRVAHFETAWGTRVPVVTSDDLRVAGVPGLVGNVSVTRNVLTLTLGDQNVRVAIEPAREIGKPSIWWRLKRLG